MAVEEGGPGYPQFDYAALGFEQLDFDSVVAFDIGQAIGFLRSLATAMAGAPTERSFRALSQVYEWYYGWVGEQDKWRSTLNPDNTVQSEFGRWYNSKLPDPSDGFVWDVDPEVRRAENRVDASDALAADLSAFASAPEDYRQFDVLAPQAGESAPTPTPGATPPGVTNPDGTGIDVTSGLDDPGGERQVPGGGQVWRVDGVHLYMVYQVPGTNVPLVWRIEDPDRLQAIFPDGNPEISRELTQAEFQKFSPWQVGGVSQELLLTDENPWDVFIGEWEKAKQLRPWLDDPSMLATIAVAYLEGREPTLDELAQTDWWNNTTEAERGWLESSVTAGTAEVARRVEDQKAKVRESLRKGGMENPSEEVVALIAEKTLTGKWSETYASQQVRKLTDPFADGDLDGDLRAAALGPTVTQEFIATGDRNRQGEESVKALASRWLGPTMGNLSEEQLAKWASRIRNEDDAQDEFIDFLKQQRLALLPGYTNPNLTYEDIVSPLQNLAANIWGQPVQDQALLVDLANMMDYTAASQRLRTVGLERGISKVSQDALKGLGATSLGQQVLSSSI